MFPERRKNVKKYTILIKSKVTSFLVGYRNRYERFPMKQLNSLVRHHGYNALSKLYIKGKSIEYDVAIKDCKKLYNSLKKKLNPSYFNIYIKGFTSDCKSCESEAEIKAIYNKYVKEIDKEFKSMEKDLNECIMLLKEVNRALRETNRKSVKKKRL